MENSTGPRAPRTRRRVGGGMVAHRLVEALVDRGEGDRPPAGRSTLLAEEPRRAVRPRRADLVLLRPRPRGPGARRPRPVAASRASSCDAASRSPRVDREARVGHDGRRPDLPVRRARAGHRLVRRSCRRCPGTRPAGLLRLPHDRRRRRAAAVGGATARPHRRGRPGPWCAVVGGGLLGLEAAGALTALGVETHVVEFAPRLMPLQVDEGGGEALRRLVEALGVASHAGTATSTADRRPATGGWRGWTSPTGRRRLLDVDVVVFAAGVRPRDELARACRAAGGASAAGSSSTRRCRTDGPDGSGRSARSPASRGARAGLVAPGYTMAEVVADRLLGGTATFPGADLSTKLKLLGVDVASFGDAFASRRGRARASSTPTRWPASTRSSCSPTTPAPCSAASSSATRRAYAALRPMVGRPLGGDPAAWLLPEGAERRRRRGDLPDDATVCSCNNVTAGAIRRAVTEDGCTDVAGGQGVHQGRHELRLLPAAGEEAGDHRAARRRRRASATRCASTSTSRRAAAVRRRAGRRASARFSELVGAARPRARLRHLQARSSPRSSPASATATCSTASRRRCRTPTTT